ncbi:unnamed protein product [Ambrosiozyma monospora]|uniref:Unnamed protein product n=1 Tax=Ambrosiozyma monospora TaxID=43982 RepID=A0ACB5ST98_AMBMO|nr:unnamed protein product [Ambrosiozyma monospora]
MSSQKATTVAIAEPSLSLKYDQSTPLIEQITQLIQDRGYNNDRLYESDGVFLEDQIGSQLPNIDGANGNKIDPSLSRWGSSTNTISGDGMMDGSRMPQSDDDFPLDYMQTAGTNGESAENYQFSGSEYVTLSNQPMVCVDPAMYMASPAGMYFHDQLLLDQTTPVAPMMFAQQQQQHDQRVHAQQQAQQQVQQQAEQQKQQQLQQQQQMGSQQQPPVQIVQQRQPPQLNQTLLYSSNSTISPSNLWLSGTPTSAAMRMAAPSSASLLQPMYAITTPVGNPLMFSAPQIPTKSTTSARSKPSAVNQNQPSFADEQALQPQIVQQQTPVRYMMNTPMMFSGTAMTPVLEGLEFDQAGQQMLTSFSPNTAQQQQQQQQYLCYQPSPYYADMPVLQPMSARTAQFRSPVAAIQTANAGGHSMKGFPLPQAMNPTPSRESFLNNIATEKSARVTAAISKKKIQELYGKDTVHSVRGNVRIGKPVPTRGALNPTLQRLNIDAIFDEAEEEEASQSASAIAADSAAVVADDAVDMIKSEDLGMLGETTGSVADSTGGDNESATSVSSAGGSAQASDVEMMKKNGINSVTTTLSPNTAASFIDPELS